MLVNRSELPNPKQASLKKHTTNSNLLPAQFPFFPYLPSELNKNYMLDFAFFFPIKNFVLCKFLLYFRVFFNVTHALIVLFYSRSYTLQIPGFQFGLPNTKIVLIHLFFILILFYDVICVNNKNFSSLSFPFLPQGSPPTVS